MSYGGILGKSTTTWTNDQILSTATAALYGLSSNAVPDEAFVSIKNLINTLQSTVDNAPKIVNGSYVGTATAGDRPGKYQTITLPATPKTERPEPEPEPYIPTMEDRMSTMESALVTMMMEGA